MQHVLCPESKRLKHKAFEMQGRHVSSQGDLMKSERCLRSFILISCLGKVICDLQCPRSFTVLIHCLGVRICSLQGSSAMVMQRKLTPYFPYFPTVNPILTPTFLGGSEPYFCRIVFLQGFGGCSSARTTQALVTLSPALFIHRKKEALEGGGSESCRQSKTALCGAYFIKNR